MALTQGCPSQTARQTPPSETATPVAARERSPLPPDRTLFARLAPQDLALHAKTVVEALETRDQGQPHGWQGSEPGLHGVVTVVETRGLEEGRLVCRSFYDELTFRGERQKVGDVACWHDGGWLWLREEPVWPVAEGLPLRFDHYEVKHGGTLFDVADVSGVSVEELQRLNPDLTGRLSKGTRVRLP